MRALLINEKLMSAGRTEFRVCGNGILAIRALQSFSCLGSIFYDLRIHGRHHESETHAEAGAGLSRILRRFLKSHSRFHLQEFIEIIENTELALVVDGFLDLLEEG